MPKKAKELGALQVGRLSKPGLHAVGGVTGLHLQITATGARSWVLRATMGAKRRDMGLGAFPDVTLAGARDKAREARNHIDRGVDPVLERQKAQSALRAAQAVEMTFERACEEFIKARADEWRNAKHAAQWASTLDTYAAPVMGKLLVCDVEQSHVLRVLEPIWKEKTETAVRVRGRIEQVLDWAAVRGLRQGENPAAWRGRLDKLLPNPEKIAKVVHHKAIPLDDMHEFMVSLRVRDGIAARALEFLILTAARSGEVRGATWSEIDLDSAVWVIPGGRMKAGKPHRVPLSETALTLLKSLPRSNEPELTDLVFPSPAGRALSDMSISAVMRRMEAPGVPHGFRSTFRDWAAERTSFPRELAEMALAHSISNKVEAAYRRGDLLAKRTQLMNAWADFCDKPKAAGSQVIQLPRAA